MASTSAPQPHPAALLLDDIFSKAHLQLILDSETHDPRQQEGREGSQSGNRDASGNQRQLAFYDETLRPRIELYLPPTAALPSPDSTSSASSLTFPLPLPQDSPGDVLEYQKQEEELSQGNLPKLISIFLSSLQLNLEASYVSPQPIPIPLHHQSAFQSSQSNVNLNPLPTVPSDESGYQLQPSSSQSFQSSNPPLSLTPVAMQHYQNSAPATFYSSSWFGHKGPTDHSEERARQKEKENGSLKDDDQNSHVSWIAGKDGKGRWKFVWEAKTPVVYVRSRHNSPLITLTATLSLRMSSHLLSILLPFSPSDSELSTPFPSHDLLTNLSSGPIYPDESPLERSTRSHKHLSSNLSNLKLEKLGREILGSDLVTLNQGRKSLLELTKKEVSIPLPEEDESDLADFGHSSNLNSSKKDSDRRKNVGGIDEFDLSDVGSRSGYKLQNQENKTASKGSAVGSEVRIIKRSCRRTLDVRSAISVRMRTLLAPPLAKDQSRTSSRKIYHSSAGDDQQDNNPDGSGYDSDQGSDSESDHSDLEMESELSAARDSSLERALVLCVELENPSDSGIRFAIESCSIKMEEDRVGRKAPSSSECQAKLNATLLEDDNAKFPLVLNQGHQINALYYVELNLGEEEISNVLLDDEKSNHRHVTIVVEGRPLPLNDSGISVDSEVQGYNLERDDASKRIASASLTDSPPKPNSLYSIPNFTSTWNCQIDTTVLHNALKRRKAASLISSSRHAISVPTSTSSATIVAGHSDVSASALAQSAAEEAFQFQSLTLNPQINSPQGRKNVSPNLPRSPMNPNFPPSGPPSALNQRRDTLSVDSPIGISLNRARLASLTGAGAVPFSPTSVTPRSSSFGLGPPPSIRDSSVSSNPSLDASGVARTPSGGVGLGLLATARNRASSLHKSSSDASTTPDSSQPSSMPAQQRPLLERISSLNSPRTSAHPASPATDLLPKTKGDPSWAPSNGNGAKNVLPWTSSSGPSAASLSRGIDGQAPILVSTKVEVARRVRHGQSVRTSRSGSSIPSVKVLEIFYLVVTIFSRDIENRSFLISWPQVQVDSDGEIPLQKDGQTALVKGPGGSLVPNTLLNKGRLLDADGGRRAHAIALSSSSRSALLPEENHLMIGPILPGTAEAIHLPIKALTPGIHALAPDGLVIADVETGEERKIWDVGNVVVMEEDDA